MHILAIFMVLASMVVGIGAVVFWIWTLIDCVTNKRLPESQKVLWALLIFFVGIIGSLVYFFVGRTPKVYVPVQPYVPAQPYAYAQPAYDPPQVEQAPVVESYPEYQEGYRARENPRPDLASSALAANEEPSAPQQVQHEHIQISYPE